MAKVDGTGAGRLVGSGQERSEGFATGGPKIKGEGRSGGGCGQRQVLLQPALPTPPPTPPPQMTPQHRHCRRHYHHPPAAACGRYEGGGEGQSHRQGWRMGPWADSAAAAVAVKPWPQVLARRARVHCVPCPCMSSSQTPVHRMPIKADLTKIV